MNEPHRAVAQMTKMLELLSRWLDKGEAYAKDKSFDVEVLVAARLVPDQFPLLRQVQSACDAAKFAAARVAGRQAPSHPDTEQNLSELRQRIATTVEYLKTFDTKAFDGADARLVELPFLEGKKLAALGYLTEMATPNFYFHVITAYAILRHNGVDLGKRDFIGSLPIIDS